MIENNFTLPSIRLYPTRYEEVFKRFERALAQEFLRRIFPAREKSSIVASLTSLQARELLDDLKSENLISERVKLFIDKCAVLDLCNGNPNLTMGLCDWHTHDVVAS